MSLDSNTRGGADEELGFAVRIAHFAEQLLIYLDLGVRVVDPVLVNSGFLYLQVPKVGGADLHGFHGIGRRANFHFNEVVLDAALLCADKDALPVDVTLADRQSSGEVTHSASTARAWLLA
jgi:hypothetical protein